MEYQRGFIQNIVVIGLILVVVFLSQQPFFKAAISHAYAQAEGQGGAWWSKTSHWFQAGVWPGVSRGANNTKDVATQEIQKQKNNFLQATWEKLKDYFAQKFSHTFGTEVH